MADILQSIITPQLGEIALALGGHVGGGGPSSYLGFVSGGTRRGNNQPSNLKFYNSVFAVPIYEAGTGTVFRFYNYYLTAAGGVIGPGAAQNQASVFAGGTWKQLTFSGSATGSLGDKLYIDADPLPDNVPVGDCMVREWRSSPGGIQYIGQGAGGAPVQIDTSKGEAFEYSGTTIAAKLNGEAVSNDGVNIAARPSALRMTTKATVAIFGTSVFYGLYDGVADATGEAGVASRALADFGHNCFAVGSDTLANLLATGKRDICFTEANANASHILMPDVVNDIVGGQSVAQIIANLKLFQALFPGKRFLWPTTTPITSAGTFPAGTGQTTSANNQVRVDLNNIARALGVGQNMPYPIQACLDFADLYETNASASSTPVRDGGLWLANAGQDNLHPSTQTAGNRKATSAKSTFTPLVHR